MNNMIRLTDQNKWLNWCINNLVDPLYDHISGHGVYRLVSVGQTAVPRIQSKPALHIDSWTLLLARESSVKVALYGFERDGRLLATGFNDGSTTYVQIRPHNMLPADFKFLIDKAYQEQFTFSGGRPVNPYRANQVEGSSLETAGSLGAPNIQETFLQGISQQRVGAYIPPIQHSGKDRRPTTLPNILEG